MQDDLDETQRFLNRIFFTNFFHKWCTLLRTVRWHKSNPEDDRKIPFDANKNTFSRSTGQTVTIFVWNDIDCTFIAFRREFRWGPLRWHFSYTRHLSRIHPGVWESLNMSKNWSFFHYNSYSCRLKVVIKKQHEPNLHICKVLYIRSITEDCKSHI